MPDVPFWIRLCVLLFVLGAAAAWDRRRHGVEATRWREYGFLLGCAALGGVFAVVNDLLVSAQLSPDYFVVAKAIETGPGFLWRVAQLAFHAGFLAGALVGGVLLLANQPRPERSTLSWRALLAKALGVLPVAVLAAPLGALLIAALDPSWLRERSSFLTADEQTRLRAVWGLHLGLYVGGLLGAVIAVWRVRRARLSLAGRDPAPAP